MSASIVKRSLEASAAATGKWRFRPSIWPTIATLLLFPMLLWLGGWQLERADFKQTQEGRAEAENARPPAMAGAELMGTDFGPESWNHRRVTASGRYLPRQFLLDNRTRRGVAGYHVLTPLLLDEERALGVMINRGWIPLGPDRSVLPEITVLAGRLVAKGRSRVPGETFLLGEAGYGGDSWPRVVQSIELGMMEQALGIDLLPFVIELDRSEPHGFDREWRVYGGISPQRHRAYAFQWFALAGTLLAIYVIVNLRRR